ncbi:hypothetical protein CH63R_01047 [Colletotrichum higginsianum IMI 349063]|uniref:DUF202 domain-containing protein n=1 Tax=Colletotrichum higginsianum (strain IMI 349063) TaxID=759273 RepID=A0A1B7YUZ6_COLHI|nr:hypothetical protein CH63R_01047 [Colletotrichum higginsianum IMI 349063]OBR15867.1 hypothetical protein CH63R_01047 [Colletotrichum higginsianum IMI 349063]GJC91870.1 hypothetical protein ColKHC_00696 [Colletotrichum higginsianum]
MFQVRTLISFGESIGAFPFPFPFPFPLLYQRRIAVPFLREPTSLTGVVSSQPNPQDHLHLRLHRARSVILTAEELVEIRAAQRTFEGAYMRTALSQFSFALIILKIFTSEFYAIGALFAVYGAAVMLVAIFRRHEGNRQFFTSPKEDERGGVSVVRKFRTSGNSVALLTALSLAAYVTLLVLTWQLVQ